MTFQSKWAKLLGHDLCINLDKMVMLSAIQFTANMGSLSIREGIPSFRLICLNEPNEAELFNLTQLQSKELKVLLEPVEGSSQTVKLSDRTDTKSESQKLRDLIFVWWKEAKLHGEKREFEDFYISSHKWIRGMVDDKLAELKGY